LGMDECATPVGARSPFGAIACPLWVIRVVSGVPAASPLILQLQT
jgi:hypothetical protein